MNQWRRCSLLPRGLHKDGIRARGVKNFAASRKNAGSNFLAPEMKQYLFNGGGTLPETFSSAQSDGRTGAAFKLPQLFGKAIQTHVQELSVNQTSSYRNLLLGLASTNCPPVPDSWVFQPGWTCYKRGFEPCQVEYPEEDALLFDAEVCVQESFAPVLATAVSCSAWYSWVSPALVHRTNQSRKPVYVNDLVPLGNAGKKPRVVIGHYVCFDSARVSESYDLPLSGLKFFDTMAAHISVSGITDLQRYFLLNTSKKPEWAEFACANSLSHLHDLYCGQALDKTERNVFVHGSISDIAERFQELTTYCALDVQATHSVFCKLLPLFLERNPHGATLAAILDMSSMFVPVAGNLNSTVNCVNEASVSNDKEVLQLLQELATDALKLMENDQFKDDPWMWDQDWSIARKSSHPEWFRKLTSQKGSDVHISIRQNIAAKLMRLCWGSFPLHYEKEHGWGMLVPTTKASPVQDRSVPVESIRNLCNSVSSRPRLSYDPALRDYISLQTAIPAFNSGVTSGQFGFKEKGENSTQSYIQNGILFKKLPHYVSLEKNVGGALSTHLLTNSCLRSENAKASKILSNLRKNLFWKRSGKALVSIPVVWFDKDLSRGAVVPSSSAFGDFTRHPKEHLFSTLCNEAKGSTGTEVSGALRAPPGWCFLSAGIPQLDLWMASLLADSMRGNYGATPIGQMFVEGKVYSSMSEHMKLTVPQCALLFHAVLWGANRRYLAKLLREINPLLNEFSVYEKSDQLLKYLCGHPAVLKSSHLSPGGILCDFLLKLTEMSKSKVIATPILESRLSRVLEGDVQRYFALTQNWLIRSSVADYLHVLMLCFRDQMPSGRLCSVGSINMHIKYLVPESEKYSAAKALHISHLYAVAFCAAKVGFEDVPKIAAELPFVTLSSLIREDVSNDSQKLNFQEALSHPQSDLPNENLFTPP